MIQPLRRNHFWIWVALSTVLSALLTAGLMVRRATMPKNPGVNWGQYK